MSIRLALIFGIIGIQVCTVAAILVSSYLSTERVLLSHAKHLMDSASLVATEHAERFLSAAQVTADLTRRLADHDVLHTDDFEGMAVYFYETLRVNPAFSGIYYGSADGSFVFVKRDEEKAKGGYLTKIITFPERRREVRLTWQDSEFLPLETRLQPGDSFDPRARPWFKGAIGGQGHVWTEPYIFYTSQQPGISAAHPVLQDGKTIGVVGVDIEIGSLSDFLAGLDISEHALPFVMNHNGDVIAFPNLDKIKLPAAEDSGALRFAKITDLEDRGARAAFKSLGLPEGTFAIDKAIVTEFVLDGEDHFASFTPILRPHLPWTVGIYASENDFLDALVENQRTNIAIAVAITLVACLLGLLLWRGMARPMRQLRDYALQVREGNFDDGASIRTAYNEISETVASIRHMVAGLQERDRRNRELAEGLREREAELHQAQKLEAIGLLTGGVAHDFNNLLGVIVSNLEVLKQSLGDREEERRLAESAIHAAFKGADLTERLLAFASRQTLAPEYIVINALVEDLIGLLHNTVDEAIEIRPRLAADLWPTKVDRAQMEAALLNLVTNARQAMASGGRLSIETENITLEADSAEAPGEIRGEVVPGPYVLVTVSDTGVGMTKEVLDRVFEPFFSTKPRGEGSGLGLSMIHGFIKQSRGHVGIASKPGAGTTVKLYLPATPGAEVATPAPATLAEPKLPSGGTILIVEDHPDVREAVAAIIAHLGYATRLAADGAAALAMLRRGEPVDLLFTDLRLPDGLSGTQLADQARQLRPGLKVLFTTGYAAEAIEPGGLLEEGVNLVKKPFRRQELAARLRAILAGD